MPSLHNGWKSTQVFRGMGRNPPTLIFQIKTCGIKVAKLRCLQSISSDR